MHRACLWLYADGELDAKLQEAFKQMFGDDDAVGNDNMCAQAVDLALVDSILEDLEAAGTIQPQPDITDLPQPLVEQARLDYMQSLGRDARTIATPSVIVRHYKIWRAWCGAANLAQLQHSPPASLPTNCVSSAVHWTRWI